MNNPGLTGNKAKRIRKSFRDFFAVIQEYDPKRYELLKAYEAFIDKQVKRILADEKPDIAYSG